MVDEFFNGLAFCSGHGDGDYMTEISVNASGKFRRAPEADLQDNSAAMAENKNLDPARRRLLDLAEKAGESLNALSLKLGKNRSYLENFVRKGSPRELAFEDRADLARLLNCAPEQLVVEKRNRPFPKQSVAGIVEPKLPSRDRGHRADLYEPLTEPVFLIGRVQAGAWVESHRLPEEQWTRMDLPADPLFPGVPRYALRNVGESMNRECANGGIWVFVELQDLTGIGPKPGDYVIVERKRHDGLYEATCKRLEIRGGKPWLCPDSTDPTFQPFPITGDDEIDEIVVRGLVVQVINAPGRRPK